MPIQGFIGNPANAYFTAQGQLNDTLRNLIDQERQRKLDAALLPQRQAQTEMLKAQLGEFLRQKQEEDAYKSAVTAQLKTLSGGVPNEQFKTWQETGNRQRDLMGNENIPITPDVVAALNNQNAAKPPQMRPATPEDYVRQLLPTTLQYKSDTGIAEALKLYLDEKKVDPMTLLMARGANAQSLQEQRLKAQADLQNKNSQDAMTRLLTGLRAKSDVKLSVNGLNNEENMALNRAIDQGRLDPYKVNSRTAKIFAQQEMTNPGMNFNELGAQANFMRSPATSNTKALLNTIDPLLNQLDRAGKALGNVGSPAVNKAVNWVKSNVTGDEELTAFQNLRDDTVVEIERGLMGTGVLSDSKYNRAIKNINEAQNYDQLKAAIANTRTVIQARLESMNTGPYPGAANSPGTRETKAPQPVAKKVVERRRTASGKVLVKYSDGTIGAE